MRTACKMAAVRASEFSFAQRCLLWPMLQMGVTANRLTYCRGLLAVVITGFLVREHLFAHRGQLPVWLCGAYVIGWMTDVIDGSMASLQIKLGLPHSKNGAHLDPYIDRLLAWPIFCYFFPFLGPVAQILIGIILAGEACVFVVRKSAEKKNELIPSNVFGKLFMTLVWVTLFLLLAAFEKFAGFVPLMLGAAVACSMGSVVAYRIARRRGACL